MDKDAKVFRLLATVFTSRPKNDIYFIGLYKFHHYKSYLSIYLIYKPIK